MGENAAVPSLTFLPLSHALNVFSINLSISCIYIYLSSEFCYRESRNITHSASRHAQKRIYFVVNYNKITEIMNIHVFNKPFRTSVLARQPSRAADSLLRSRGGGDGDPLCVLASRRWGPTYIASYTHTLGSWVDFYEVLQPLMWWRNR
jgi:hypothetical protein